jgi:hypothetical protein
MKNITKNFIKIFLIFLFAQRIFSQTNWEPDNNLNTTMRTYLNGSMGYDVTYDNYGLHMAAICQPSCNKQLSYFHFDNNGQKLDSMKNIESNVSGVCIGSYKGKVYLITIKEDIYKIYERVNGVSELQLKLSFNPEFYRGVGSENNYSNMSMTFLNDCIYFLWDRAVYDIPGFLWTDLMGFGRYNTLTNTMETFVPPNLVPFPEFPKNFHFPRIIALSNKLVAVYTYTQEGSANDTLFITQEISFDVNGTPVYGLFQGVKGWGNPPLGATYNGFQQTRANIQAVGDKIFLYANLGYLFSGNPPYYIDNKFKIKLIEEEWNSNWEFTALNSKSFYKFPGLDYNPIRNTIGYTYTSYSGIYNGNFIEYFINSSQLGSPQSLTQPGSQTLTGGALNNSIHGDYVIFDLDNATSGRFVGIRRPSDLSGEINYNTLLTRYEYFNAPIPPYCRTNGADVEALAYSTTRLKANTRVFIDEGDLIIFRANSCLIYEANTEIFPSDRLIYETNCITWENLACNRTYPGGSIEFANKLAHTVNNGGFIVIDSNSTLKIADSTELVFYGSNSFLKLMPGSTVKLGNNSTMKFVNGAYLNSKGVNFTGLISSTLSNGIFLENSGLDTIINCTFSNAKTALSFINDEQHKFTNRIIKNCTFNIPTGGDHKGIYGENNYSILVEGNRFNMPTSPGGSPFYTGLYLKNVTPSSPPEAAGEEGASSTPYSLNIVNNTFRNGSSGIVLANYTSNLLPYYIKGNRFDSLDAHAATVNIIGMKITGTIKDNVLSSSQSPIGIHLINSSPNLLNNIIVARDVSLHLVGSSYANLAPNIYNNQAYWSAGRNTLSSYLYDNIQLAYMGNAYTDYGRNKFTVSNDSAYHIYGWLDTNVLRYHSRDNCWYTSGAAKIYLRHPGETMPVLSTIYNRGIDCNSSPAPISWEVDNLGNGIFDSVLVSNDVSDSLPTEEEILIAQCEHYLNEMQMFGEAMISLKYYIDDYPEGEYTNDALMNLYTAYLYLDTSANQNNRNILFGNLINYCEDKVASNLYDTQFEYLAGDVIAMCNFELDNYDDAMNWYEFIALFYPDPDVRLTASWNYAEIEALIGSGSGGGEVEIENGKWKIDEV